MSFSAVALAASPLSAQDDPPPQIDDRGRPLPIPVTAFTANAALGSAILSRTGKRLALREDKNGRALVHIVDAETRILEQTIDAGKDDDFNWLRWAGDDRLLLSTMREEKNALFWARSSKLLVFDIPSAKMSFVGRKGQGLEGDDILYVDPRGAFVVLSLSDAGREPPKVWRIPLDGSAPDSAVLVEDANGDVDEWWADSAGVVRIGMGRTQRDAVKVSYRSGPGQPFTRVTKIGAEDKDAMDAWDIVGLKPGSDIGLTVVSSDGGKRVLREIDYRTGALGRVVFEDPRWDVLDVLFDADRNPAGVRILAEGTRSVWFDPAAAAAQKAVTAALGAPARVISVAEKGGRMLVMQDGSDDPGALYIYTPGKAQLDFFANLRPDIDYRVLAKGTAHDITTRDGKTMQVLLTLPRGRGDKHLPLVVMPHGGPYGVRDTLDYSDWVQLLANRGYAVMQPNFRGSGGLGKAWEDAGDGEIGRRMQDDLDDAVGWAVARGVVDPARVCVAGASYGGYAAMWAVTRNPELYRCAVSWAGVTDLKAQLAYDAGYLGRKFYNREWKAKISGDTSDFSLDDVSPHDQIKRLQRPILLAAGKKDQRVPLSQYRAMAGAAERLGKPVETLLLDDGHSLTEDGNEAKFLQAMVDFLARNLPVD